MPMQKIRRNRLDPWPGKIPWSRKTAPTPVFLPGKSHGQRRLVGCSPWGHKELDRMSIHTHTHTHTSTYISWDLPFGTTCLLKLFTMIICFLYRIHANIIALKKVSLNVQTILARIPICLSSHICIWIYLQFSSIVYIFLKMC